jgi:L-lactate dehydrogenase complex protein LldG
MSAAREEILRRIGAATGSVAPVPVPRRYRRAGDLGEEARVERFCERAADYEARVHRVAAADLDAALSARCEELGARRVVAAAAAPGRLHGVEVETDDPPIAATRLDQLDGVLTGCATAIAETGTVVLDGSPPCGRRALTLVPDLHLCVVDAGSIVETVPEALAALAPAAAAGAPLTFVSGPSATSDIELSRVDGVHGPRKLELFVIWY